MQHARQQIGVAACRQRVEEVTRHELDAVHKVGVRKRRSRLRDDGRRVYEDAYRPRGRMKDRAQQNASTAPDVHNSPQTSEVVHVHDLLRLVGRPTGHRRLEHRAVLRVALQVVEKGLAVEPLERRPTALDAFEQPLGRSVVEL